MDGDYGRAGLGQVPGAETMTPGLRAPGKGPDTGIRIPPGALIQYYSDLSSGMLPPEDMRLEDLQFRVRIDSTGAITFEDRAVTLLSRYMFAFRRVSGFMLDPDFAGSSPALVNFQIQEEGRDFTIFKRPVSMASLLAGTGSSGNQAQWDGVYITIPGTNLAVVWTIDSARWPALVGTSKEFGVQLLGDYVVCRGNF